MCSSIFQTKMEEFDTELDNNIKKIIELNRKMGSIRSPLRFPGSKAQAIKLIKPFWEAVNHDEFREPFVGGGAVFFAKPLVKFNWINDICNELITTFKIMSDEEKRNILIQKVSNEIPSKQRHLEMKEWKPKNEMDISHKYFYLNRTSYSGIMKKPAWGFHDKKSVPPSKWGKRIEIAGKKLALSKITCLDFEEVIMTPAQGKSVFMFVDPPYFEADQKRAYEHSFTINEHERLAKILKKTKHKFCLTYDDCEGVRKLYSWANIHPVSWRYHTANSNKATRKMGNELIITNY